MFNSHIYNLVLSKFLKINPIFVILFISLLFIFGNGQNIHAQPDLGKSVYKTKSNTDPKKSKRKVTPKKETAPKSTPKRASTRSESKARTTKQRTTTKKSSSSILVKFKTSEPNQEIWRGDKNLGVSDENSMFETWMEKGNYLVSVKTAEGDIVTKSMLISVDPENNEFDLIEKEEIVEAEPKAEEMINNDFKESIDAAERINDILRRYGDPLKTNTVSLSDWEFVYQMAQANTLNNFTAIQIEAQRWFSSGQIEFAKGNYANAYAAFTKAVEFMPDSAYPFYALGNAYNANKQITDALNAYQKAVQINPKFALAYRKIGDIHLAANRPKEASVAFQSALLNGFDSPAVHYDLAKSHMKNKRWDEASKELEVVVKEAPTSDVFLTLGDLYTELKRNISAYEAYKKATELSPNSAPAFYKLGELMFSEREFEKSKVAFEKALELDEKGKEINLNQTKKYVREAAQKLR